MPYETVRPWVNHFGPTIAGQLRKCRPKPHATWHLDEVYLKIGGRMVYLWRAVDAEGQVLDVLVQSKRNKHAALKLMRKLLKKYAFAPKRLVTDDLRSYAPRPAISASSTCMSAADGGTIGRRIRISRPDDGSARCNASRAPAPRRDSSAHAAVYNTFNVQRHLTSAQSHRVLRTAAMSTWREVVAAA